MNGKGIVVISVLAAGAYLLLSGSGVSGGGAEGGGTKKATAITGINPNVPTTPTTPTIPDLFTSSPLAPTLIQYQPTPYMLDQVASQSKKNIEIAAKNMTTDKGTGLSIVPKVDLFATQTAAKKMTTDKGTGLSIVPKVDLFAPQNMNLSVSGKPNTISQAFINTVKNLNPISKAASGMTTDKGTGLSIVPKVDLFSTSNKNTTMVTSISTSTKKATSTSSSNIVRSNPGSNSAPSYGSGWM